MALPTREEASALLGQHVKDEYQQYHALTVATAMEGYARVFNEDINLWYITGLFHDIDFEEYPDWELTVAKEIAEEIRQNLNISNENQVIARGGGFSGFVRDDVAKEFFSELSETPRTIFHDAKKI